MPPHAIDHPMGINDEIEIQHVDGLRKPIVSLYSSENANKSLVDPSSSPSPDDDVSISNNQYQEAAASASASASASSGDNNSAEDDTIYDTFTSLCSVGCSDGCFVPRKSALKKPRGVGATTIQANRTVSFNSISVREYDLTLGDHPSSASGPPVQLDWEHKNESIMGLEKYEEERQPRRKRRQLKMSFKEREEILQHKGYTMEELKNAWMESLKIRQQRYETITTGSISTKVEEAWESAVRKFSRFNRLFALSENQEGYEVKAESNDSPQKFAYVQSPDEDTPLPSTWSLFDPFPCTTTTRCSI